MDDALDLQSHSWSINQFDVYVKHYCIVRDEIDFFILGLSGLDWTQIHRLMIATK